jgi:hypothetical protein
MTSLKTVIFLACTFSTLQALKQCGVDDRNGAGTCDFDDTHRVCAQILSTDGTDHDFWDITGQSAFKDDWVDRMDGGDGWCICKWATASYILAAGCPEGFFDCDATDVTNLCDSYDDFDTALKPAQECIMKLCPQYATNGYCDSSTSSSSAEMASNEQSQVPDSSGSSTMLSVGLLVGSVTLVSALVLVARNYAVTQPTALQPAAKPAFFEAGLCRHATAL